MGNVITFVTGGAALGGNLRDPLSEAAQQVCSQTRTVSYGVFTNTGNAAATVKLFWSVPRWEAQFGGTIVDGDYVIAVTHRSTGQAIASPTVTRDEDVPADEAALAVAMEAEIEGEALLDDFIVSADDDGVDLCTIVAERGADIALTATAPGTATLEITEIAPDVANVVADLVVTIPAGQTIPVYLGGRQVHRLWMAATAGVGADATPPNADLTGYVVLG